MGLEALLRWRRANGDIVMPDEFIPIAEDTRLIVPIGLWVLRESCRQMRAWRAEHPAAPPLGISVNVSTRQLHTADLTDVVRELVDEIHPDVLTLEITETAATLINDAALGKLEELRDLGVSIAIDDLGTGHSSLMRLRTLPINVVKIDRQFIRGLADSDADRSVVLAIVAMARALGLVTVAEGVETAQQAAILRQASCDLSQGYLYGRPQPAADLTSALARLPRDPSLAPVVDLVAALRPFRRREQRDRPATTLG